MCLSQIRSLAVSDCGAMRDVIVKTGISTF